MAVHIDDLSAGDVIVNERSTAICIRRGAHTVKQCEFGLAIGCAGGVHYLNWLLIGGTDRIIPGFVKQEN